MSKKTSQKDEQNDEILQNTNEIQGEQLSLLEDVNITEDEKSKKQEPKRKRRVLKMDPIIEEDEPKEEVSVDTKEDNDAEDKEEEPLEEEEIYYQGYDGTEFSESEWNSPVILNGPTRKEVEGWKQRYEGRIYFAPFDGDVFVFRTLNRPEYREIIRDSTLTALDREEIWTEKCVLFPYDFSIKKMLKGRAGIPSLLSEMIMDKSGFVAQSAPIKL